MKLKIKTLLGKGIKIDLNKEIAGQNPEDFKQSTIYKINEIVSQIKNNQKKDAKTEEYKTNIQKIDKYCLELGESLIPLVKFMLMNEELKSKFSTLSLENPLISLSYLTDSIIQTLGMSSEQLKVDYQSIVDLISHSLLKSSPFQPTGKTGEERRKVGQKKVIKKA